MTSLSIDVFIYYIHNTVSWAQGLGMVVSKSLLALHRYLPSVVSLLFVIINI